MSFIEAKTIADGVGQRPTPAAGLRMVVVF